VTVLEEVDAGRVIAPGISTVVPATIAAFSAALALGHRLTGHPVFVVTGGDPDVTGRLQVSGLGYAVVNQYR
jgi:hypothetical protein